MLMYFVGCLISVIQMPRSSPYNPISLTPLTSTELQRGGEPCRLYFAFGTAGRLCSKRGGF